MQSVEDRLTRSPFDLRPASICGQLVSLLLAYLFRVRDTSEQSGGRILFVNCRSRVVHCSAQVVRVCFHWPLSVCCVCVAVQSALIFRVSVARVCATAFQPWWFGRFLSIKTCKHSNSALHNKFSSRSPWPLPTPHLFPCTLTYNSAVLKAPWSLDN